MGGKEKEMSRYDKENELRHKAFLVMKKHKEYVDNWEEGEIEEYWEDEEEHIYIKYSNGRTWEYDLGLPFPFPTLIIK
ncbi:MAG TPA: hypothetical protein IAC14_02555 [Candidatus Scybalomonas excrementigallinarum]|nr:hypothetical protein [Candidatus Scybalomonas excrementigallinarum]